MPEQTTTNKLVERSASIKEIATALSKFQASIENVTKEAENPFFKSSYATIANIIEAIRKPLGENGLSVAQFPVGQDTLITMLMHSSGEYFLSELQMTPKDKTPQAQGSAITYARRYALSAILGIATEDDDGNSASGAAPKNTTVKMGKAGSEEEFATALIAIEKLKTTKSCDEAIVRLENANQFTDSQKDKLEQAISNRLDVLNSKD